MNETDFSKHFLTRDTFFQTFEYISDILPDPDKILNPPLCIKFFFNFFKFL